MTISAHRPTDPLDMARPESDDWTERAVCASVDPEVFFPDLKCSLDVAVAIRVCRTCPVSTQCLTAALDLNEVGIWGGTTPQQRDWMKARQRRRAPRWYGMTS